MNLTVSRKNLAEALARVRTGVGRSPLPILGQVAIQCNTASLDLTTTDLNMTIRTRCEATVRSGGETTVRAQLFHDLIRSLPAEEIQLKLEKNQLHIRAGDAAYSLGVMEMKEFPAAPTFRVVNEFKLPQAELRRLLSSTESAISQDDSRYILNGALFELNGKLNVVTTDGRRLAVSNGPLEASVHADSVVLPAAAVKELLRHLATPEAKPGPEAKVAELVAVQFGTSSKKADEDQPTAARFRLGGNDIVVTTTLIEGSYPNYRQLIPQLADGIPVLRAELLGIVQRVGLLAETVKLRFESGTLNVSVATLRSQDISGSASESLLIPKTRKRVVTLNSRYLVDCLSAITADEVEMHVMEADRIILASKAGDWLSVIAGMRDEEAAAPATETTPELPKAGAKAA
jgi:DNA polymerase III subunit beta